MPRRSTSTRGSVASAGELAAAALHLANQIRALAEEVATVRRENEELKRLLDDAIGLLEGAAAAADRPRRRRLAAAAAEPQSPATPARRRRRGGGRRGRATPEAVTPAVVLATLSKLGRPATAAEIAAEISRHGIPVSGRAIRFLAERAGARIETDAEGQRRYAV